jgi:hypothetical protein
MHRRRPCYRRPELGCRTQRHFISVEDELRQARSVPTRPADPPELLPLLAEAGNFGGFLVGEPLPEERLAWVNCPKWGEDDVNWLQARDGSEAVYCEYHGADFELHGPTVAPVSISRQAGG